MRIRWFAAAAAAAFAMVLPAPAPASATAPPATDVRIAEPVFKLPLPCGRTYTYAHWVEGGSSEVREALDFITESGGGINGMDVLASAAGKVTNHRSSGGGGHWVSIDHGGGWTTYYMHLQQESFAVATGTSVSQGQKIGKVGMTGTATGPHLHFEQLHNGTAKVIKINNQSLAPYPRNYHTKTIGSDNCGGGGEQTVTVTAWAEANVRSCERRTCTIVSKVVKDETYPAVCWTVGDTVTAEGVTNNKWVKLKLVAGGHGFVSGIYLKGNETGGVTKSC